MCSQCVLILVYIECKRVGVLHVVLVYTYCTCALILVYIASGRQLLVKRLDSLRHCRLLTYSK